MLQLRSLARECCQGVKAPVGKEVTQPDVLTISDECLGKVRGPGEKGKTNILSLLSRQVLNQRFGLVHCPSRPDGRERPGDPWRSALRHERRDHAPPARSSVDSMRASTRAGPLPSCACHSLMKACQSLSIREDRARSRGGSSQLQESDNAMHNLFRENHAIKQREDHLPPQGNAGVYHLRVLSD